jgi:hypothetical protein
VPLKSGGHVVGGAIHTYWWESSDPKQIDHWQQFRHDNGSFKKWVHIICINALYVDNEAGSEDLVQRMIIQHYAILPWLFHERNLDLEYLRAMSGLTDNFRNFPGAWNSLFRSEMGMLASRNAYWVLLDSPSASAATKWAKHRWESAGRSRANFRNSLEPFRFRSERATNRTE